jgi:hypothetical protein
MYAKRLSSEITKITVLHCPVVSDSSFLARAIPYLLINDASYASRETVTFFAPVPDIFIFIFA